MKVLIADDHRLIIEGVKTKLDELGPEVEFVVAMTVDELDHQLERPPLPDIAILDLSMPGASGPDHIAAVMRRYPDLPVVVLSGAEDATQMRVLLDLGVRGYIPKAYSPDIMLSAVRLVMSGGVYIPPMLLSAAPPGAAAHATGDHRPGGSVDALRQLLTERQIEVLRLLSQGKPNKSIARDLNISEGTVKIHLAAIFRALDVRNRVEAVVASRKLSDL
jgi:DNA-binding NarL/FixJ family response regulator